MFWKRIGLSLVGDILGWEGVEAGGWSVFGGGIFVGSYSGDSEVFSIVYTEFLVILFIIKYL